MFSNTAQSLQAALHSISHSAFNVLNILRGTGYIKEWWPCIIRTIYTFLKLHLPECIQPKQSLAPPHSNNLLSPQLLWTTYRFSVATRNLLHLFSWLQPSTSFNHLCDFFKKPQIFLSPIFNNHLLMHVSYIKWLMEDENN